METGDVTRHLGPFSCDACFRPHADLVLMRVIARYWSYVQDNDFSFAAVLCQLPVSKLPKINKKVIAAYIIFKNKKYKKQFRVDPYLETRPFTGMFNVNYQISDLAFANFRTTSECGFVLLMSCWEELNISWLYPVYDESPEVLRNV